MTIKSITLQNFQSHKDTRLELSAGVNAIIGPSDSGKTAILRALRWAAWNKPSGDALRSSWGGDTVVCVEVDEQGQQVVRSRTDKENLYQVGDIELRAFGADVPSPVRTALNIEEVNLQQQLDRPFLLDDSPGQVAQFLNKVAHLDVIDTAISRISKWTKDLSSTSDRLTAQAAALQKGIDQLSYLPQMEADVAMVEEMESQVRDLDRQTGALSRMLNEGKNAKTAYDRIHKVAVLLPVCEEAVAMADAQQACEKETAQLDALIQQIIQGAVKLQRIDKVMDLSESVDELHLEHARVTALIKEAKELNAMIGRITDARKQLDNLLNKIHSSQEELMENMPAVCPLCLQEVPHETHA